MNGPSILDRFNTPIIRACVLNLIGQIALGTPMAAQARRNLISPCSIHRKGIAGGLAKIREQAKAPPRGHAAVKRHKN